MPGRTLWGLVGAVLWGCGSPECSKDTVEQDGQCVPADPPTEQGGPGDEEGVPDLALSPGALDFGQVEVPCAASSPLTLENAGDSDLVISEIALSAGGEGLSLDPASLPPLPLTLSPGETAEVSVIFEAAGEGESQGTLSVSSNDPEGTTSASLRGAGIYGRVQTDSFTALPTPVDVMLLIDQSGAMEVDNTQAVETGIPLFLDTLSGTSWQLLQVTQETACGNGGVLDVSTPNLEAELVSHAFDYTYTSTYYTESLFQLASMALAQTAPGQCNEGFLRPGAELHLVIISDEPEQSGSLPGAWMADFQSYASSVVVSAVVDINLTCGEGAGGYAGAAQATGGAILDICDSGWGSQMGGLVGLSLSLQLTEPALEETIDVLADGIAMSNFDYDPATGVLTLHGRYPEGTPIEVSYAVVGECSP